MSKTDNVMPLDAICDWDERLARVDAFWTGDLIDRPVTRIIFPKVDPPHPFPKKIHATHCDRWLDVEYVAECALAGVMNTEYLGDALPSVFPNLGPEVFSAFYGLELHYGADTAWSIPILDDWTDADRVRLSEDNFYWKKIGELTDALIEIGRGKFYTGMTDLHPGADAIAAFRDPARLNMDVLFARNEIAKLLKRITNDYLRVFDHYCEKLRGAGQPVSTWPPIVSTRKWAIPSNDFSCMISQRDFDDLFLPGIIEECRHMEANIYHLDGPKALRHLDSLLEVKEIDAIQWMQGSGNGPASDWLAVYGKCQKAGKALQIELSIGELPLLIENLRPEGLNLGIQDVVDHEQARWVLDRVTRWR